MITVRLHHNEIKPKPRHVNQCYNATVLFGRVTQQQITSDIYSPGKIHR